MARMAITWGQPRPQFATVGAIEFHDTLTQSSGSFLVDAGVGALAGYLIAPAKQQVLYAVGGAAATGFAGLFGLLAVLGAAYLRRS